MPSHNPECTHGAAHSYSACRDSRGTALKMLEDPEESKTDVEGSPIAPEVPPASNPGAQLTDADREALSRALAGLAPQDPS